MRRIVFIVLIVIVIGIVGFFCWREFSTPKINFVSDFINADYVNSNSESRVKINRLYAAEVDFDAFDKALDDIVDITEFTEEERLAAAIASGRPELYQSFNFNVYKIDGEVRVNGFIDAELAPGQKSEQFKVGKISLEAVVLGNDFEIDRVEVVPFSGEEDKAVTKIHTPQQAAVDISKVSFFEIVLAGGDGTAIGAGTVTLRFVFDIKSDTFIPKTVLKEQLLEINAEITTDEFGRLQVDWSLSPFSDLEEANEQ